MITNEIVIALENMIAEQRKTNPTSILELKLPKILKDAPNYLGPSWKKGVIFTESPDHKTICKVYIPLLGV